MRRRRGGVVAVARRREDGVLSEVWRRSSGFDRSPRNVAHPSMFDPMRSKGPVGRWRGCEYKDHVRITLDHVAQGSIVIGLKLTGASEYARTNFFFFDVPFQFI
jgi:hypothetical protein